MLELFCYHTAGYVSMHPCICTCAITPYHIDMGNGILKEERNKEYRRKTRCPRQFSRHRSIDQADMQPTMLALETSITKH